MHGHSTLGLSCAISVGGIMYVIILMVHVFCHNSSQWILDVLICNWIGTYLGKLRHLSQNHSHVGITHYSIGMKVCQYLEVKVGIADPLHYLCLKYILSLMNGAVSDKLTDYVRKPDVCLANFHPMISLHSNGGLPHPSHITSP